MKVSTIFTVFLCLLTGFSVQAQNKSIYVEYNPACMDRYEYRFNNGGHAHIAYHIRLNDREKVILEVGIENKLVHPVRPKELQSCSDIHINERLVRSINDGETLVYVVRKDKNGYNVSPVGIASYAQISPTFIGVSSIDHKFVYNFSQRASDQNIATATSTAKVLYRGGEGFGCPKKLRFEKVKEKAGRNYAEFILIPEIGIVEEKTGFNKTDADNNKLTLNSINGIPLQSYISQFCTKRAYTNVNSGTFYNTGQYTGTAGSTTTTTPGTNVWDIENNLPGHTTSGTTTGTTTVPPAGTSPTTGSGMGTCPVYKDLDRNLYIDRTSGQPATLSCGGNTYHNGFLVTDGSVVTTTPPTSTTTTPTTTTGSTVVYVEPTSANNPCGIASGNGIHVVQKGETLYGISRLYGVSVSRIKSMNGLSGNMISTCQKLKVGQSTAVNTTATVPFTPTTAKFHTVQRGETLYGIATRYGYTVDRLRTMNNMSKTDPLYINQRLVINDCNCPDPSGAPTAIPTAAEFTPAEEMIPREFDATAATRAVSGKRRVHIVKDSETIYSIAKQYGLEDSQLRRLNNLEENEVIIPYQRLYIE